MDLNKLKVPDLKKELKLRGLSTTGNKNELIERLQQYMQANDMSTASVDDFEEDLLNDEEDEHLEDAEINDFPLDDADSPKTKANLKRKSEEDVKTSAPAKKVILNRNNSTTEPKVPEVPANTDENKSEGSNEEKKVVKLSSLTAKERLEMRAKKFGLPLSDDAKKVARAERFSSNNSGSAASIKTPVNTSLDVLKQRAERFGGSVSKVMSKVENQEKLEQRKARFGGVANNNGLSNSDKAKLRLERFKQAVK